MSVSSPRGITPSTTHSSGLSTISARQNSAAGGSFAAKGPGAPLRLFEPFLLLDSTFFFDSTLLFEPPPLPGPPPGSTTPRAGPAEIDAVFGPAEPWTSHPLAAEWSAYSGSGKAQAGGVLKHFLRIGQLLS